MPNKSLDFANLKWGPAPGEVKNKHLYTQKEIETFPLLKPLWETCDKFYTDQSLHLLSQLTAITTPYTKNKEEKFDYSYNLSFEVRHNTQCIAVGHFFTIPNVSSWESAMPDDSLTVKEWYQDKNSVGVEPKEKEYHFVSENAPKKFKKELEEVVVLRSLVSYTQSRHISEKETFDTVQKILDFYEKHLTPEVLKKPTNQKLPLWFADILLGSALRGLNEVARFCAHSEATRTYGGHKTYVLPESPIALEDLLLVDAVRGLKHTSLTREFKNIDKISAHTPIKELSHITNNSGYRSATATLDTAHRLLVLLYLQNKPNLRYNGFTGTLIKSPETLKNLMRSPLWNKIDAVAVKEFISCARHKENTEHPKLEQELWDTISAQGDKKLLETNLISRSEHNAPEPSKVLKI